MWQNAVDFPAQIERNDRSIHHDKRPFAAIARSSASGRLESFRQSDIFD